MSRKIFRVGPPWFPSSTIGIMLDSDDPHKAKGFLFSQADSPVESRRDSNFVRIILQNQSAIEGLRKRIAEAEKLLMKSASFIWHYEDCAALVNDKEKCTCGHDDHEMDVLEYHERYVESGVS